MARGWGKSEEDMGAEKEHARDARASGSGTRTDAERSAKVHAIRLSLARIEEQLALTANEPRRRALETARRELQDQLAAVEPSRPGNDS
ncbi:MAG: hypothetical protein ABI592_15880 [Acidobacteriota bacterium]